MPNIRDIINKEQLEREFESIRRIFDGLTSGEKPLRIEWGTKEAFEKAEAVQRLEYRGHGMANVDCDRCPLLRICNDIREVITCDRLCPLTLAIAKSYRG